MTLDEKAIIRLNARRQAIIDITSAKLTKMDAVRAAIITEAQGMIAAVDAKIAFINSAPRYIRPKAVRAPTAKQLAIAEQRRKDDELALSIANARAEAERSRQQEPE